MRKFVKAGSCSLEDTMYVPPCPMNWYAHGGACVACPSLSHTLSSGATSLVSVLCWLGLIRLRRMHIYIWYD